ncbi:MAG: helix-turn-helix domain-containing protein [Patescibacteria group bacterium]|jgi:sugar-specific transcriptional regulator TrmB
MATLSLLRETGISEKEARVYLFLLETGPSSIRTIASSTDINRGSVHDALKSMQKLGLVSYFHKSTHQYFVAEDPEKIALLIDDRAQKLQQTKKNIIEALPDLRSRMQSVANQPVVKYYEGPSGIKTILQDVLTTMTGYPKKEYYAYSSADVREYLYTDFPNFAKKRIQKGITVKVIALGSGGSLWGLDERRWLTKTESSPAYIILYANKMAMISIDLEKKLHGVILTDENIVSTQKLIFEQLYRTLT